MTCKRCGRNVPVHSKVCPSCGLDNPNYQPRQENTYEQPRQTTAQHYSQQQSRQSAPTQQKPAASGKGSPLKTIVLLAVAVVLVILLVRQCGPLRLKGTWVTADGYGFTFVDDSSGYIFHDGSTLNTSERSKDFTYHIDGDELEIKTEDTLYSYSDVMRFEFKISGDKLTLTEVETGESMVFYKE